MLAKIRTTIMNTLDVVTNWLIAPPISMPDLTIRWDYVKGMYV